MSSTVVSRSPSEKRIDFRIARRQEDFQGAFRLLYEEYVRAGLMRENRHGVRLTPWHLLPSTELFVAVQDEQTIATVSLVRDGELGVPMESIFPDEVARLRSQEIAFAEVSCLADRGARVNRAFDVVMQIMGLMAQTAKQRCIDTLLVAVHPRHARFYRRFLGFEPLGDTRSYDAVCGNPAVPLNLSLPWVEVHRPEIYRKFSEMRFGEEALSYRPISSDVRAYLNRLARVETEDGCKQRTRRDDQHQAVCV